MHSLVALLAAVVLTNAADVASVLRRAERGVPFDLRVTMVTECAPERRSFTAEDATGPLSFMNHDPRWPNQRFAPGDLVRIVGRSETNDLPKVIARCIALERIGHGKPPQPVDANIAGLKRGDFDHRLIRLRGTVRECFRDEIDHDHCYLVLDADGGSVYAILWAADVPLERLRPLTGAEIAVTGICCPDSSGYRRMLGRIVECVGLDAIRVLRPAANDPFAVEPLRRPTVTNPEDFTAMPRRRLSGTVLAVWKRRNLLFVDDDATVHNIRLAEATPPPRGLRIEAAGRPVTDLYRANLTDAIWRPDPSRAARPLPPPVPTSAREIYTDKAGKPGIKPFYHGRAIRLRGTVLDVTRDLAGDLGLTLKCDGINIPADASACAEALRGVEAGCTVDVAGICVVETASWSSYSSFPHSTGITLVVSDPADVTVLARPPWWTPARLLAVIGALLAALVGVFIWNRVLRHLVEKRSRQLFREQVAHVASDLRVGERTRLAVELHDSISQNLAGAAFHIGIVGQTMGHDGAKALKHLDIAARTLGSCRDEMHNCIWDLRNQALEEPDLNVAITRILAQVIGDAKLTVRFNVPRSRLSDNTTHALLRIIRELATNAVRHGRAAQIRVAGALDEDRLLFSVSDDGRGFDPLHHPGVDEGHFGLQGIAERVKELDGTLTVDSAPGRGTRVEISLKTHGASGEAASRRL